MYLLEIACDSLESALHAQAGGAHRIELCDNLAQGGITPSFGKIKLAKRLLNIPIFVLIRPRKGDFLYSDLEFQVMLENIKQAKACGADGIVSGVLYEDGTLDIARTRQLIVAAIPLSFTFHRAFDMCQNPSKTLEQLIDLKVQTILTSGQASDVLAGATQLKQLVQQAQDRIQIMAGGGLRVHNIQAIRELGITAFHSSAKEIVPSQMQFQGHTPMGTETLQAEFEWERVSQNTVEQLSKALL